MPLSKIHHAAFDGHLIGVDPDDRIHVSERLLELHNGPFLKLGLKKIAGEPIRLSRRTADYPDRDWLDFRFEQFKRAGGTPVQWPAGGVAAFVAFSAMRV